MRRLRLTFALGAMCAALTACDAVAETARGHDDTATRTNDIERTPGPQAHSDRELAAALPRTRAQLHGLPLRATCLTMSRTCDQASDPGIAYVQGGADGDIDVAVFVFRQLIPSAWTDHVANCPQGRYKKPLEFTDDNGSYEPGERGTSRRGDWSVGTWTGFVCEKSLVYLWPKGEHSDHTETVYAFLNNGHHLLRVEGRTAAETRQFAAEYVERLERGAGAAAGP